MFEGLFGNHTVEKILIFLFVNSKCYGNELHRLLHIPLTPIQKALYRLEKGHLVLSYFEGKTRIYQFNQAFPLLPELELLLKKAYTLLPTHEKRAYYATKKLGVGPNTQVKNKIKVLLEFWDKLSSVKKLTFRAASKEKQGWNGHGNGEVSIVKEKNQSLIFYEKGTWEREKKEGLQFSNVFRWTLDRFAGVISLEHLRRGVNDPVFLFHLTPVNNSSLSSIDSHLCDGDTYFGQICFDQYSLRLTWRVIGPKKNDEISYHYA